MSSLLTISSYRTQLAILHYNENADRAQLEDEGGKRYRLKPSKLKKSWLVVPVKEGTSYGMCFTV